MKIVKKVTINKPADAIWKIIAHDFDKAYEWMGPIPHSYGIGTDKGTGGAPMEGRICHLSDTPDGAKAKEVISYYSEKDMTLTFDISPVNVPAIVPLKQNQVTMQVTAKGSDQCEVTWTARPQLKTPAYLAYPLLRMALPIAFGKLLNGLKEFAEQPASVSASAN